MTSTAEWRKQRKKVSELEDRTIKITQSEKQRENRLKKRNKVSGAYEIMTKHLTCLLLESQRTKKKRADIK